MCRALSIHLLAALAAIGCGPAAEKKAEQAVAQQTALIAYNQEVEEAEDAFQAGIEETLSIWGPDEPLMDIDLTGDLLGLVRARVHPRFTDPTCVTATATPGHPTAIEYQLSGCESRSGVGGISGKVTSLWFRSRESLVHAVQGGHLQIAGSRQTVNATVTFSRTDTTLTRTRQGSRTGQLPSGKAFTANGLRSLTYGLADGCETRDGMVTVVYDNAVVFVSTEFMVKRCGRVGRARPCPISGLLVLTPGSMPTPKIYVSYDGTPVPRVEGAGPVMLRCTPSVAPRDAGF